MVIRLDRDSARRIAVRAQLLSARPADIVETVDGLLSVTIEPTAAIAPAADLILYSRLGWPYQHADLVRVVADRALFEYGSRYRTMADLPLLRPRMRAWPPWQKHRDWLAANTRFRRDVLDRLRGDGPLRAAEIPDTAEVSWQSTGWTNNRNTMQMLEFLVAQGDVAISSRDGKGRVFDLAERVYPVGLPELTAEEAAHELAHRRLASLGVARAGALAESDEPVDPAQVGEAAIVEGTDGEWRVDPELLDADALDADGFVARTVLLSPFDRLVTDRDRLREIFDFEYLLEMYKPAAKRRWGYFALPILHGDRFVGKLDAKADRKAGVLRVFAVHEDVPFDAATADAVHAEIEQLARWLGLSCVFTEE